MITRFLICAFVLFEAINVVAQTPETFEKKGKFGLRDAQSGKELVKPKYEAVNSVEDGTAIVTDKGLMGVINTSGKELVKCKMINIDRISPEYMLMNSKDDKYYIFSTTKQKNYQLVDVRAVVDDGKTLITAVTAGIVWGSPMYDLGDVTILLDNNKKMIAGKRSLDEAVNKPENKRLQEYAEKGFQPIAMLKTFEMQDVDSKSYVIFPNLKNELCMYLVKDEALIPEKATFDSNFCWFNNDWSVYDMHADKIYRCTGLNQELYKDSDNRWYYISKSGGVCSKGYDSMSIGYAGISVKTGDYWSLIDFPENQTNERVVVTSPIPTHETPFVNIVRKNKSWLLRNDAAKVGVIGIDGNMELECVYDSIDCNWTDRATLYKNHKMSLYSISKKSMITAEYDSILGTQGDYVCVMKSGKCYMLSINDNKLSIPFDKYKGCIDSQYNIVEKNGAFGLMDGINVIIPFKYKEISSYNSAPIVIVKTASGSIGAYNYRGKLVAAPGVKTSFGFCVKNHLIVNRGNNISIVNVQTGKVVVPLSKGVPFCAGEKGVVVAIPVNDIKMKLVAYSDSGKVLGTKIVYSYLSNAFEDIAWLNKMCPDNQFYPYIM